jgi:hypothetical protein
MGKLGFARDLGIRVPVCKADVGATQIDAHNLDYDGQRRIGSDGRRNSPALLPTRGDTWFRLGRRGGAGRGAAVG